MDSKFIYGMLVVGVLVVIFNFFIGVGIVLKVVFLSILGMLFCYGLKLFGEKVMWVQIEYKVKQVEEYVFVQFVVVIMFKVINFIFNELEFVLCINEQEYDLLYDFNLVNVSLFVFEYCDWWYLMEVVISYVYKEILVDLEKYVKVKLGLEDICWLQVLLVGKQFLFINKV